MNLKTSVQLTSLAAFMAIQGCGVVTPPTNDIPDFGSQALSNPGDSEVCAFSIGLEDPGYRSAEVTYPCDLSQSSYPSTTLTGGFTNTKEQMKWLSSHLTSHGYVVITMTPTNRFGNPTVWETAHKAGFNKLAEQNGNSQSPVFDKIDLTKRAITGFSMGGGGVLLAAEDLDGANKATLALAPYLSFDLPDFGELQGPLMILGSENDDLAPNSLAFYSQMSPNIERGVAMFAGANHYDWYDTGSAAQKQRFQTLVTAFLDATVKEDTSAYSYFEGAEHLEHLQQGWFSAYEYNR